MRLYSWNVNGWRAARRKGLDTWVAQAQPDVLCVQETKADPQRLSAAEAQLPGYHGDWAVAQRPGYSGVATFCRKAGQLRQTELGVTGLDGEGRVLVHDCGAFDLYNVYFPNGKKDPQRLQFKLDFYTAFLAQLRERLAQGRPAIFCGDVNTAHQPMDLARPAENRKISGFLPEECAHLDAWDGAGWRDSFRCLHPDQVTYSWWSQRTAARERNIGWRLDYFWVHQSLWSRVRGAGIATEVTGSDHCPVWLELED